MAHASGTSTRTLFAADFARDRFTTDIFSASHGAFGGFLGAGYLYYACAAAIRSQVSVCIGSGGGFVPDLLAQVQRDLALSPAATYLIDANLPDLEFGSPTQPGGWLRPENEFLRQASDIVILPMLSTDAAALFARQGVQIDYLHIDGDHSTRGVVADFADFLPLLSPRAAVSMHDLYLPGVRQAMAHIRARYPDWDCLAFAEIGAGSALLRRRHADLPRFLPGAEGEFVDPGRRVLMDPADVRSSAAASSHRAQFERWHYLETASYRSRYALIADLIDRDGGTVVEVGGFPNSVIDVLRASKYLIAMEPYAPDDYVRRIEGVAGERGIAFRLTPGTVAAPLLALDALPDFALVWLGLDVSAACEDMASFRASLTGLLRLIGIAGIVAIELPQHVPSALIWRLIQDCLRPAIQRDITLDLSADPVGEAHHITDGRSQRRVIVFEASRRLSSDHDGAIESCAERLLTIKERHSPKQQGTRESHRLSAAELPSNLGTSPDGVERLAVAGEDEAGCFTFGPYLRLQPGRHRATIRYSSPAAASVGVGSWDICIGGGDVPDRGELHGTDGVPADHDFLFELTPRNSQFQIEIRIFFGGSADMRLSELLVEPAD